MSILFISDLHLEDERPEISRAFFHFLATYATKAKELYILGDFFEVWIGDDAAHPLAEQVSKAIKDVTNQGCKVYFLPGNRDFLLGNGYLKPAEITLIAEPFRLMSNDGKVIILLHGDTLCTDDTEYQAFRKMVRAPEWQAEFLTKPIEERQAIARHIRNESKKAAGNKSYEIMDVNIDSVERTFLENGADIMIHGHTHRPGKHVHTIDQRKVDRIVLGDWSESGWYLELYKNELTLHSFPI